MRSLHEALGGRLLAVLTLLLVAPLLAAGSHAAAQAASTPDVPRAPIDTPMTGLLPACPDNLMSFSQKDVWVEDDPASAFSTHSESGLEQNCAWQNMQTRPPGDTNLWPRAMTAVAEPNTIPINDDPVTVQFQAEAAAAPGPFNTSSPPCMPVSTRPAGCSDPGDPSFYVAYRLATGAGTFVGKWTHAGLNANPYFDFTRTSCPDQYPGWANNYEHNGWPCTYELNFATNVNGAPVLNDAMQVVVAMRWRTGTTDEPEFGYEAVVPMLFTPGGSTELTLGSLPTSVPHGTQVTLSADAVGPAAGTAVSFFRKPPGGAATQVGQDTTDAGGEASLVVTASGNAEYYASLSSPALESSKRALGVTRVLGMKKIKKLEGRKVKITGTVDPGATGKVQLQLKGKKGWSTKKTATAKQTVTWTLKAPKGKSTWRIVSVATVDFLESVSRSKSVTVPAD